MIKRQLDTIILVPCPRVEHEYPESGYLINSDECISQCEFCVEEECEVEMMVCSYSKDLELVMEWLEDVLPYCNERGLNYVRIFYRSHHLSHFHRKKARFSKLYLPSES